MAASRRLRVATLGASAGIGGVVVESFLKEGTWGRSILGPSVGGAGSAWLANKVSGIPFDNVWAILVVGAAAGLGASVLAKRLLEGASLEQDRPGGLLIKGLIGTILGGATGSMSADSFAPPELRLQ